MCCWPYKRGKKRRVQRIQIATRKAEPTLPPTTEMFLVGEKKEQLLRGRGLHL
jgi:hypothetical protein